MALDRKTYRFTFGVDVGNGVDSDDRISLSGHTVWESILSFGRGLSFFNENPVTAEQVEEIRVLRALWIRYLSFPVFLGGFMHGGSDNREIAYLANVTGPTAVDAAFFANTPAGTELGVEFHTSPDSSSTTFISGIREIGQDGEIYIITNPGRIDSDGVTQADAAIGEPVLVVPDLPVGPEVSVRSGNIKVLETFIEAGTESRIVSQGTNAIIVPAHVARERVLGVATGIDFSLPDTSGVVTIGGQESYLLQTANELSPRRFQLELIRNIPEGDV